MTFKELNCLEEAEKWLQENYNQELLKQLNDINLEYSILKYYIGSFYSVYNDYLRTNEILISVIQKKLPKKNNEILWEAKKLYTYISKNEIKENIVLYRFMTKKSFKEIMKNVSKNQVIIDYGFVSTTLINDSLAIKELIKKNKYKVLIKIYTEKGIHAIPIYYDHNKSLLNEYEILLNSGTNFLYLGKEGNHHSFMAIKT